MSESPYPYAPPPGGQEGQEGPEGPGLQASGPPSSEPEPISPRPQTVSTAITLVWVAIGLYVVGLVVGLVSGDLTGSFAAAADPGEPVSLQVMTIITVVVAVVGGIFFLLYVGFGVLLALMLRAGRSWPRIVLAIGAGLDLVGLVITIGLAVVFALNGPSIVIPVSPLGLQLVVDLLITAALVAAVVLLFRRPSSAWFAERRAARVRARGQVGVGLPGGEGWFPQGDQQPDLYR